MGANQNAQKLLSTDLVNTNIIHCIVEVVQGFAVERFIFLSIFCTKTRLIMPLQVNYATSRLIMPLQVNYKETQDVSKYPLTNMGFG